MTFPHNCVCVRACFCGLSWTVWIWKTRGFSRTAQPVTLRAKQWSCWEKNFLAVSSQQWRSELATEIVRFVTVRLLSLGGLWNLVSKPTNHKQFLSSRRRLDVLLAKLSRDYAEMSSRSSSKEEKCASGVVGDICRILCSTINRSVCTLYWNKSINTFWIDDAFY